MIRLESGQSDLMKDEPYLNSGVLRNSMKIGEGEWKPTHRLCGVILICENQSGKVKILNIRLQEPEDYCMRFIVYSKDVGAATLQVSGS